MAQKSKYADVFIPDSLSCSQFVVGKFEQYGERTAVVDASSGSSYTFKQLKDLSWKFASGLTKRGLKKGDVLAVILPNVIQYPVIYFGALSLGITLTTLNPQYKADELVYQLRDAGVRYIITDHEKLPCVQRAAFQVGISAIFTLEKVKGFESFYELVEDQGDGFLTDAKINPKEDVAVLLYSSGTTGLPKGCMLTHYNLVALYCTLGEDSISNYSSRSVVLSLLPLFHGYGQTAIMGTGLCKGAKLVILQQFVPELFLQTLEHYKVTNAPLVPPVALFLAKHPIVDNYDISSMCDVLCGGAPVGDELFIALRKRLPHIKLVRRGYGLTECVSGTHISSVYGSKPHSSGGLIPNLECKIVHPETNATLGTNEVGEICIRGPTVMKGYLNKPEATAQTIDREGWVHTGDIGHCDEDGYLYVVDRKKELIKYKGFQVPPAELEALLISHPNIDDAAVVGVPDVIAGEVPKAFVVRRGHVTTKEIGDFVSMKVAPYKKLRGGVEFVDQIPKSPSGKILRRILIEQQKKAKL